MFSGAIEFVFDKEKDIKVIIKAVIKVMKMCVECRNVQE